MENNEAGLIRKQYESVRNYKRSMGFEKNWSKYVDFVEDRQWETTDKNKNMPKPQHNIIKFAKKAKTSAVLSDNIKVMFSPVEQVEGDIANEAADMFNHAVEATIEEVEQDRLDYEVVNDSFTLGTGFVHYYWDNSVKGGYKTNYIGSMRGEVIDPANVFPGNPQQKDKDKQPFWIITYRESVDAIKKEAKANGVTKELINAIVGDKDTEKESYEASKHEVDTEPKTTVYCVYKRGLEDGKIYFTKCTDSVVFKPKTALWDYSGTDVEPYPIAYFDWEDRKKSLFGIGEVEGMIYNQKAINFISAMQILNVQDTGWSKYLVKNGALKQKIQNVPGEVITDYNAVPGQDGIKPMQHATMSPQAFQVLDNVIDHTRTFNGVSESVTGESLGANMAASAIIALQNQAKVPLDAVRKKFYRYRKEVGKIWEFFFKCKYNLPRSIKAKDDEGNESNVTFTGTDYKDIPLSLKIDVGAGSSYSEALSMTTLDKFLDKGFITPVQYAELATENAMPWRERFKKMKEEEEQSLMTQATQTINSQQKKIQELQMQLGIMPPMQQSNMPVPAPQM